MTNNDCAGIWIDHQRAIIVSLSGDHAATTTLESEVGAHPHFGGQQDGGGEKKYEERRHQDLDRYYDQVVGHVAQAARLLLLGPGEAKLELKARLDRSKAHAGRTVQIQTADRLTEAQVVATVRDHFKVGR
jgi:hypothetical protein